MHTHTQNSQNRLLLLFRFSRINLCVLIVNKKTKKKFPAIICGLCVRFWLTNKHRNKKPKPKMRKKKLLLGKKTKTSGEIE